MNALNRFADPVYCISRLVIGLMFACHGGQKILGFPPGGHGMPGDMLGWIGATIELVGGFLIAFGFLTRIAAFFAAGEMAVAYFMVHAPNHLFPIVNKGETAVFYCWFFFFAIFYGPGRWSIDALLMKTPDRNRGLSQTTVTS
ncbi:MAG TPA: DoxX family protein [Candidatus Udaeobacter sp.]|jgi:putative oxidoreductase|nr:DoxX family protein [Candidatus Udaeobacter sp.]